MRTRHFAQLVALSALWGSSFLFLRIASPALTPLPLAGIRVALAMVTLVIIMRAMRQAWPWRHWRELLVLGALTVTVPFLLYAWASIYLPAGYSALLNTTAVLFGTLAAAWLKEDTLTPHKLVGCALGFVGVGLIVQLGPVQLDGPTIVAVLACILASACYGCSTPLMKRATTRMEPLAIAAGIHAAAILILAPGAVWAWPKATFTAPALLAVGVLGLITSGLAYWVHLRIIRHVSPVAAISPAFMIPIFGVTWGHLFLGEELSSGLFIGGALVLVATGLVTGFNPFKRWLAASPAP
ncbi:MAG: EamA family transporter [Hydrogenophaga sp.]|uniref:DMT family transporter n=1 Tax=Hydrogenophaga sp. TaxID=1904254 RepID=UPI001DEDF010|nr:DMT family transporter [Hydrogenophaga sp.]MBX3610939.1 EamA family transporter [Hydrogenophaga sp.]